MIREAKIEDADRMAEIHVYGWRHAYRGIVGDDYLYGKLKVAKRGPAIAKAISEGLEENYVYEDGAIVKAFMTIGKCRDADAPEAFELWGIYVEPSFKGLGIGSAMVKFCEEKALERGHGEVVLWVFADNADSRRFYEKAGYLPDGKVQTIDYFKRDEVRYRKRLRA